MKPAKKPFWAKWKREVEKEVPNKFRQPPTGFVPDAAVQTVYNNRGNNIMTSAPIMNFDGTNNGQNVGRVTPPDPTGAVGLTDYVQVVNGMFQVFSKTGTSLYGPVQTSTLWNGFTGNWTGHDDGDGIVLYDANADRWLISQFAINCTGSPYTEYELVAISATNDPTGSYYRYAFQFDYMPDYPKLGVWQDGYYLSVNRFNTNLGSEPFIGVGAAVLERSKMLTGDPTARMVYFKTETLGGSGSGAGSNCWAMLPSDCDATFATAGTPNYFAYIDGSAELRLWAFHTDWVTTTNCTFTYVTALPVTAYTEEDSGSVPEQGTLALDGLGDRLMFRNQYRNFGTYETFVTCHSVNTGSNIAGIRWYEYRKTGSTFALYQQSTYAPSDGLSRWMGSIAMNANGDIGLAYSVSSSTMYPSIYYTGRKSTDPLNTMTVAEGLIQTGTVSMTSYSRWGDYSAMSIDPSDNTTFWTTQEYVGTYGGWCPWSTKIASFNISTPTIASFTPASGPVGTLVTITGTDLSYPTAFTIGGTAAIVISNSGTTLVGMVMPGTVTGVISITTAGGSVSSSSNFTVTATPYPSIQQGNKLVGTGNTGAARQGSSLSISADGNTAIMGGNYDNSNQGAVWVFTRSGTTWSQQGSKLVGTGNTGIAAQGCSVAVSADGNTAIVGGVGDNTYQGATWVFTRSGIIWSQQGSKLVGTGNTGVAQQGCSVAVSADGNTAIVGGNYDNSNQGAAWIFTRSGTSWSQQGNKLVGTGNTGAARQGTSVSLSADGNTAIVGGDGDNSNQGAAWVFTRTGSVWSQQGNKLVGTGAVGTEEQGSSVSLSADGNTAIVGGSYDNSQQGAAWIWTRSGSNWSQQGSKLVGTGNTGPAYQGWSVSLSADGNTAIVGGSGDNSDQGATWVFTRSGTIWSQKGNKLVGTGNTGSAYQGMSVALSADGNTAIEGGPFDNSEQGAGWVLVSQTCANPTNGGTIASSQTICQGSSPSAFTSTADPSGYSGTLEYKWQYSVSPFTTWNDIASSNSKTYASGALSVTTEFKRLARVNCMSDWSGAIASNILMVTVTPSVGTPTAITIAAGTEPTCQLTNGTTTTTYATTATNNTGFNWSVSNGAAGSIGATTGIMTWANGFSGTVNIQVTANGCNGPSVMVIRTVTVNIRPIPTISGSASVCQNSTGNVYTTQAGMTGYTWSVSTGGTITAGGTGTSNTVTVTWNTLGAQTVSVNYTSGNGCTAAAPVVYNITVNSGATAYAGPNATICEISAYSLSISSATNYLTLLWTTSGTGSFSNPNVLKPVYTPSAADISSGSVILTLTATATCWNASSSMILSISRQPIANAGSNATICETATYTLSGSSAQYYSTINWITSGTGNFNNSSVLHPVYTPSAADIAAGSVVLTLLGYANAPCTNVTSSMTLTITKAPIANAGPNSAICQGTAFSIVGASASNFASILWTAPGPGVLTNATTLSPTYTPTAGQTGTVILTLTANPNTGCAAAVSTMTLTIDSLPTSVISGPTTVCATSTGNVYSTPNIGGHTYAWAISGGTITSGAGTNSITVTWNAAGSGWVQVTETITATSCAVTTAHYNVTINPLPTPVISGPNTVCLGSTGNVYNTQAGMSGYVWSVSPGGVVTSGGTSTSSSVTISWTTTGTKTVSVNYSNSNGCTAASQTVYNVTVNPLPIPTITGTSSVCVGTTGVVYTTESGMSGYTWTVSPGGTITTGSGTATIVVSWTTAGAQTVTVNYVNSNGCTASSATTKNVTVNALPVPTITGSTSICAGTSGVIYSTETGMTGYIWNVSAGGTITSGAGTNQIIVTWNTAGAQTVSANYTNVKGCTATSPTIKNILITPVYVPTITGTSALCISTQTYVYTTETGMTNYIWHISSGGTITSGGTTSSHTVTIRWNSIGSQWVSVNYSNSYGCSAATATIYPVAVNALPVPTIAGANNLCAGTTGVVYTTQTGMINYIWSVSAGGTITAGGTSTNNTVTVTWNTTGTQSVSVNYATAAGCTAPSPVSLPVTVNATPQPTITGSASMCAGTSGFVYTTQTGMSNYTWYVSSGGTITAGGTSTSSTVTVTWNTAGAQHVSVNYTNASGCQAVLPVVLNVTVNALPTPTITGSSTLCSGVSGTYTTESGKTNYTWTVSTGGTIVTGGGTTSATITVKWTTTGSQWVRVNYTNSTGCRAATYTQFNITVNSLPAPTITGQKTLCQGSTGIVYTTQSGMAGYTWTISTGGTITAGSGTNAITVSWTGYGAQWVSVNYSNTAGCTAVTAVQYTVTVNQAPVPSINGIFSLCTNTTVTYNTEAGMTNYVWTVSSGGTITSGVGTRQVNVLWNTAGANTISVIYNPTNGCQVVAPTVKAVTVYALPTPTITGPISPCVGAYEYYSTETGMTNYSWLLGGSGGIIYSGFNSHQIEVQWTLSGAQTVSVNYTAPGGCRAPSPTVLNVNAINCPDTMTTGIDTNHTYASFTVYPNPNNGRFIALIQCECSGNCTLDVFNMMGVKVFELTNLIMQSKMEVPIDLQDLPNGIYMVSFRNSDQWMIRKIVINK